MKGLILIIITLQAVSFSYSQDSVSYCFYGTSGDERAIKLFKDENGLKLFGSSGGYQGQNSDILIIEAKAEGLEPNSFQNYGGWTLEQLVDVVWDTTAGQYVALSQFYNGYSSFDYDLRLDVFSVENELIQSSIIELNGNQRPISIDSRNGLIYVLFADELREGSYVLILNFELTQIDEFELSEDFIPSDILVHNELLLVSGTDQNELDSANGVILKMNLAGNLIAKWSFGGISQDSLISIMPKSDTTFLAIGASKSFNLLEDFDAWIFEFSVSGNLKWNRHYGYNIGSNFQRDDIGSDAHVFDDGRILFGVTTSTFGSGEEDFQVFSMNDSVEYLNAGSFGFAAGDFLEDILVIDDSSIYLFGTSSSRGAGQDDYLLVELNESLNSTPVKLKEFTDTNIVFDALGRNELNTRKLPFSISETAAQYSLYFHSDKSFEICVTNSSGNIIYRDWHAGGLRSHSIQKSKLSSSGLLIFSLKGAYSEEIYSVKRVYVK